MMPSHAGSGGRPAPGQRWPLVGRDRELAVVLTAYRRMRDRLRAGPDRQARGAGGYDAGVVLLGAAGVGKTRLATEAVARLAAAGAPTTWATATRSAATIPLGALAHLLTADDRQAVPGSLEAMAALVARFTAAGGDPPVVAVDDVHLLDDASAALIHHLASRGRAFVLLTARTGEPAPDAVTALWADGPAERVDVRALGDAATAQLLAHAVDGPLDPISGRELRHLCAGNPMLLRELLRAGQTGGALRRVGGVWRWTGEGYVTTRLVDVVVGRLGSWGSGGPLRPVAEALACGQPLPVPMLEDLCGRDALAHAERRRLVVIENSGSRLVVRLAHPLYAEVIRASMPRYREVQLARRLAEAIESTPMRRRDDVLSAARWRLRAGLPARPGPALVAVAHALDRAELVLAEELARAARRAGGGWPADLALAEVLVAQGQYRQAAATLPAPPPRDSDRDAWVRWRIAGDRIRYWGGSPDWSDVDGWDDRGGEPAVSAARSWLSILEGQSAEGLRQASGALRSAHLAPDAANWAASATIAALGLLGRHGQAMAALRRGLAVAESNRDAHPWGKAQVAASGCLALLACGRLAEAAEAAEHGYREALELTASMRSAGPLVGVWAAVRGVVARNQGRAGPALAALGEATALLEQWPAFRLARVYLAQRAAAHAITGDAAAAADWLRRADELGGSPGRLFDAWLERDRGWVVAAAGDLTAAAGHAHRAADLARATGQPAFEALALYDAVRFSVGTGAAAAVGRLAGLAAEYGDGIVPTLAQAASALDAGDAALTLDQVAAALAGAGHLVYAAEAAAEAYHRHAKAGRRVRAQASLGRATELLRECGQVRTQLLDLTGAENSLTARELHVARLAATGQSGPSIAAKLGLSVRTVNNHLGRVYSKLGVTGRTELAEMIASLSPGSAAR
jgi:DNA-binding CsgD family transcriptional regulator